MTDCKSDKHLEARDCRYSCLILIWITHPVDAQSQSWERNFSLSLNFIHINHNHLKRAPFRNWSSNLRNHQICNMASNLSNASFPDSSSNHSVDFAFSTSTLAICHTGGIISFVTNIGLLNYARLNFNLADPFDGPLLLVLYINAIAHLLLGITSISGYFDKFDPSPN